MFSGFDDPVIFLRQLFTYKVLDRDHSPRSLATWAGFMPLDELERISEKNPTYWFQALVNVAVMAFGLMVWSKLHIAVPLLAKGPGLYRTFTGNQLLGIVHQITHTGLWGAAGIMAFIGYGVLVHRLMQEVIRRILGLGESEIKIHTWRTTVLGVCSIIKLTIYQMFALLALVGFLDFSLEGLLIGTAALLLLMVGVFYVLIIPDMKGVYKNRYPKDAIRLKAWWLEAAFSVMSLSGLVAVLYYAGLLSYFARSWLTFSL